MVPIATPTPISSKTNNSTPCQMGSYAVPLFFINGVILVQNFKNSFKLLLCIIFKQKHEDNGPLNIDQTSETNSITSIFFPLLENKVRTKQSTQLINRYYSSDYRLHTAAILILLFNLVKNLGLEEQLNANQL